MNDCEISSLAAEADKKWLPVDPRFDIGTTLFAHANCVGCPALTVEAAAAARYVNVRPSQDNLIGNSEAIDTLSRADQERISEELQERTKYAGSLQCRFICEVEDCWLRSESR
jgi:hypothetical protein